MDKYDIFYLKIVVAIAIATIIFFGGYQYGLSKLDTTVQVDTLHVRDTVYSKQPVLVSSEPIIVPAVVDTAAILKEHFKMNVYRDTVVLKEYGTITVTDTVFENQLGGRAFTYDLNIPTYTAVKKTTFNIGGGAWYQDDSYGLIGSVRVKHFILSGGYDLLNKKPHFSAQYLFGK